MLILRRWRSVSSGADLVLDMLHGPSRFPPIQLPEDPKVVELDSNLGAMFLQFMHVHNHMSASFAPIPYHRLMKGLGDSITSWQARAPSPVAPYAGYFVRTDYEQAHKLFTKEGSQSFLEVFEAANKAFAWSRRYQSKEELNLKAHVDLTIMWHGPKSHPLELPPIPLNRGFFMDVQSLHRFKDPRASGLAELVEILEQYGKLAYEFHFLRTYGRPALSNPKKALDLIRDIVSYSKLKEVLILRNKMTQSPTSLLHRYIGLLSLRNQHLGWFEELASYLHQTNSSPVPEVSFPIPPSVGWLQPYLRAPPQMPQVEISSTPELEVLGSNLISMEFWTWLWNTAPDKFRQFWDASASFQEYLDHVLQTSTKDSKIWMGQLVLNDEDAARDFLQSLLLQPRPGAVRFLKSQEQQMLVVRPLKPLILPSLPDMSQATRFVLLHTDAAYLSVGERTLITNFRMLGSATYNFYTTYWLVKSTTSASSAYLNPIRKLLLSESYASQLLDDARMFTLFADKEYISHLVQARNSNKFAEKQLSSYLACAVIQGVDVRSWVKQQVDLMLKLSEAGPDAFTDYYRNLPTFSLDRSFVRRCVRRAKRWKGHRFDTSSSGSSYRESPPPTFATSAPAAWVNLVVMRLTFNLPLLEYLNARQGYTEAIHASLETLADDPHDLIFKAIDSGHENQLLRFIFYAIGHGYNMPRIDVDINFNAPKQTPVPAPPVTGSPVSKLGLVNFHISRKHFPARSHMPDLCSKLGSIGREYLRYVNRKNGTTPELIEILELGMTHSAIALSSELVFAVPSLRSIIEAQLKTKYYVRLLGAAAFRQALGALVLENESLAEAYVKQVTDSFQDVDLELFWSIVGTLVRRT